MLWFLQQWLLQTCLSKFLVCYICGSSLPLTRLGYSVGDCSSALFPQQSCLLLLHWNTHSPTSLAVYVRVFHTFPIHHCCRGGEWGGGGPIGFDSISFVSKLKTFPQLFVSRRSKNTKKGFGISPSVDSFHFWLPSACFLSALPSQDTAKWILCGSLPLFFFFQPSQGSTFFSSPLRHFLSLHCFLRPF